MEITITVTARIDSEDPSAAQALVDLIESAAPWMLDDVSVQLTVEEV